MDGAWEFIKVWNLPGWGMFLLMMIALIKTWPIIQKNLLDARESRESRYGSRIRDLEKAVADCQERELNREEAMRKELAGLRDQHLAQQLALVRTIIEIFPEAPKLQLLLKALETGQRSAAYIGEVVGDAGEHKT